MHVRWYHFCEYTYLNRLLFMPYSYTLNKLHKLIIYSIGVCLLEQQKVLAFGCFRYLAVFLSS